MHIGIYEPRSPGMTNSACPFPGQRHSTTQGETVIKFVQIQLNILASWRPINLGLIYAGIYGNILPSSTPCVAAINQNEIHIIFIVLHNFAYKHTRRHILGGSVCGVGFDSVFPVKRFNKVESTCQ